MRPAAVSALLQVPGRGQGPAYEGSNMLNGWLVDSLEPAPVTPGAPAGHGGYSGTPLAKKLGVKPNQRVLLRTAPRGWTVPGLPAGAKIIRGGDQADVVVAFFREAVEMAREVPALGQLIAPDGLLWLAWPRLRAVIRAT